MSEGMMESYVELQETLANTREELALLMDNDEKKLVRIKAGMLDSAEQEVYELRKKLDETGRRKA